MDLISLDLADYGLPYHLAVYVFAAPTPGTSQVQYALAQHLLLDGVLVADHYTAAHLDDFRAPAVAVALGDAAATHPLDKRLRIGPARLTGRTVCSAPNLTPFADPADLDYPFRPGRVDAATRQLARSLLRAVATDFLRR